MPGGEVPVHEGLARSLLSRFPEAQADTSAHRFEHCLEVQLPFLQHLLAGREPGWRADPLRIVPVVMRTTRHDLCRELARCLADLILDQKAARGGRPLLVASTDMNHYESDEVTRQKDGFAIEAIRKIDPEALEFTVRTREITMCGLGPTLVLLHAAPALGASCALTERSLSRGDQAN